MVSGRAATARPPRLLSSLIVREADSDNGTAVACYSYLNDKLLPTSVFQKDAKLHASVFLMEAAG